MTERAIEALIRELLEWLELRPRPYAEVMDAWRTSCPHLPVWEEATGRGYIRREKTGGTELMSVSPAGRRFLARHRSTQPAGPIPVPDLTF